MVADDEFGRELQRLPPAGQLVHHEQLRVHVGRVEGQGVAQETLRVGRVLCSHPGNSWGEADGALNRGDGPEAVTAALKAAIELNWRPMASKMAVLIADAPPHGIGE